MARCALAIGADDGLAFDFLADVIPRKAHADSVRLGLSVSANITRSSVDNFDASHGDSAILARVDAAGAAGRAAISEHAKKL